MKSNFQYMKYFLVISLLIATLSGCSTTYRIVPPDQRTGMIPTLGKVPSHEVKVDKKINLSAYQKLLVVGIRNEVPPNSEESGSNKFWIKSIENMNFFKHVVSTDDLALFLVQQGYGNKVPPDLFDLVALHKLQRIYGNFLLVDIILIDNGADRDKLVFKVIDPKDAKTYFEVQRKITNWVGLDENLFYP